MSTSTLAYVGRTRGGAEWYPRYIMSLDQSLCIGCGRCFKTCSRAVFQLVEREQDEDDDCEETSKVMQIVDALDCIGCEACSKVCPKSCLKHEAL
jgi:Nif-specific ferredoxin III